MDDVAMFDLKTDQAGAPHTITVVVHGTRAQMIEYLSWEAPDTDWTEEDEHGAGVAGVFLGAGGFHHNQAPDWLGVIRLNREDLSIDVIAHEVTHAAMLIYMCDVLGVHSRAMAHVNNTNEVIAYLIGGLMGDMAQQLHDRGLYDGA